MNTKLVVMGVAVATSLSAFCGIQISKVEASQRDKETGKVDITFDVTSPSNEVSVILSAMNTDNNQTVAMNAVYDDQGNFLGNPAKIEPGAGRHLVWNSALDLGKGFYSSSMIVTVRATEGDVIPNDYAIHEKFKAIKTQAKAKLAALQKDLDTLEATAAGCVKNIAMYNEIIKKCDATNGYLVAEMNRTAEIAAMAVNDSTNCVWAVTYKNGSLDDVTVVGKGAAELFMTIEELAVAFTLRAVETSTPSSGLVTMFTTWADAKTFAQDLIKTAANATAAAKTAAEAVDANTRTRQIASQGIVIDTAKLEALDYENTKSQLNAAIGAQTAVVIQLCD